MYINFNFTYFVKYVLHLIEKFKHQLQIHKTSISIKFFKYNKIKLIQTFDRLDLGLTVLYFIISSMIQ